MMSLRYFLQSVFGWLLLGCITTGGAAAQYRNGLMGVVRGAPQQKAIPEALVELLHQSPRQAVFAETDGSYGLLDIVPGTYTLRVEAEGYSTWEQSLTIEGQDTLVLDIVLQALLPDQSTQRVRGTVTDVASGAVLGQALVELLNVSPYNATYSDELGRFVLEGVPVGRQRFRVTKRGYAEYIVRDEIITSGKEVVLAVPMEEAIAEEAAKPNQANNNPNNSTLVQQMRIVNTKMLPSNQMAIGGAYPITIEQVQRYAGCLNDPARAAVASLAGTFNTDDTQNLIVARGNSPYGNAWYIEGIPFENPNHFGTMGNTGAPFQVLNTNTLANSDFLISAAPAEYGGAVSSIFDLRIRDGNNQRFQFTGQFSLLGGEVMAEGPFRKGRASFVVAYRYSLLHVIQLLGVDITSGSAPQYQDLTFKVNVETKRAGTFSVFGTGGLGRVDLLDKDIDPDDLFAERGRDLYIHSRMGLVGLKHQKFLNRNTYLQTTLYGVHQNYQSHRDSITPDSQRVALYKVRNIRTNTGVHLLLHSKINSQYSLRVGVRGQAHILDIFDRYLHHDFTEYWSKDILLETVLYCQNQLKISDHFNISVGVHGHYFSLNKRSFAIEPRAAMNWHLGRRQTLSLAYGWHSKYPSFTMLFYVKQLADGTWDASNRDLALTRSHHLNLSYNVQLSHDWRIMAELYGQYHTHIPVTIAPSSFSMINYGEHPIYPKITGLESKGLAYNYGAELTVQKFFSQGYYGTVCGSYFRARYQGSDGVWRNTAFDARYLVQLAMGKEFKIGRLKNNVITLDLRFHHHGGRPYTPIDLAASVAQGREILNESQAYSLRVKPYSRIDFKLGARFNHRKKRISHYLYFDGINIGLFKNELKKQYSPISQQIATVYQFGLVPNLLYQINF